jgi:hypothetical protein
MSHHPVSDENQRPESDGRGDRSNVGKSTFHSDDEPQRDTSRFYPSEQITDRTALAATNETGDNELALRLVKLEVNDSRIDKNDGTQVQNAATTEINEPPSRANQTTEAGTEAGEPITEEDRLFAHERKAVLQYLLDNVAEFRELSEIRQKASKDSLSRLQTSRLI